jgi:hypothetical protein
MNDLVGIAAQDEIGRDFQGFQYHVQLDIG